jgi:hypothetical protein
MFVYFVGSGSIGFIFASLNIPDVEVTIASIFHATEQFPSQAGEFLGNRGVSGATAVENLHDLGQPLPNLGELFPELGEHFPEHGQPFPNFGQLFPELREPSPEHGQPFPELGEPFPKLGQANHKIISCLEEHFRLWLWNKLPRLDINPVGFFINCMYL